MDEMRTPVCNIEGAKQKFEQWLKRGDGIGWFQNVDLGHPGLGLNVFMPITKEEEEKCEVGRTKAPDGAYGLGWRFLLQGIIKDISDISFENGGDQ
jgi:hypothetical protein